MDASYYIASPADEDIVCKRPELTLGRSIEENLDRGVEPKREVELSDGE